MSFECMAWAARQKCGGPFTKIVLLYLANTTNHQTGACFPRVKRIAEECEMSERAVRSAIARLVEIGCLKVSNRFSNGSQISNSYMLVVPWEVEDSSCDGVQEVPSMRAGCAGEGAGGAGRITRKVNQGSLSDERDLRAHEASPRDEQQAPAKKQRPAFIPPTKEEWVEFCHQKWPWWPRVDIESSYDHYDLASPSWSKSDGSKVKAWRQCANTCHGNWARSNQPRIAEWRRRTAASKTPSAALELSTALTRAPDPETPEEKPLPLPPPGKRWFRTPEQFRAGDTNYTLIDV